MKRFLPYILIVFTLVNFLAPVGVGLGEKNLPKIETNITEAAGCDILNVSFDPYVSSETTIRPDPVTLNIEVTSECVGGIIRGSIYSNEKEIMTILATKITIPKFSYTIKTGEAYCDKDKLCEITTHLEADPANTPEESDTIKYDSGDGDKDSLLYKCVAETCNTDGWVVLSQTLTSPIVGNTVIKTYYYQIKNKDGAIVKTSGLTDQATCEDNKSKEDVGTTGNVVGSCIQTAVTQFASDPINTQDADTMPVCGINGLSISGGTVYGCAAQLIYYVLFVPTSYIFALVGNFFDWTFAYSVNDASYRSGFVVQGWGVVRDFCNMFFIFILLYVAFTTILGTNSGKTKEMIVNVVIIGLLINFSLFATQVIIDASNILARVFYNSNTIVITPNGANGQIDNTAGGVGGATTPSDPNGTGIIPLSAALVNKINPQNLIINANEVGDIQKDSNIGAAKNATNDKSLSAGRFIIVTLLAVAVNVVGFVVFITVALLFVGRVVMLWIAMILSPIVFFTYMVPAMQNFDTIGWKKWWPETLKLAFLAPVFIFFLYIILKFLQTNLVFIDSTGKTGIQMVIAVMVPFVFIMVLLLQAKKIATSMAGKMGETMSKAGSAVSGLALGAATGGAAMLGRASIGKLGDKLDKSKWVNKMAGSNNLFSKFVGNKLKDTGQKVASKSFDVRNSTLGGMAFKGMDLDSKGKTGGYTKDREDKVKKKQKRAKEIEVNEDEELTQDINALEIDLQKMLNAIDGEFKSIDKQLEDQRQIKNDTHTGSIENLKAIDEITRLKEVKKSMKEAKGNTASVTAANTTASTNRTAADAARVAAVGAAPGSLLANTAQTLERIALGSEAIAKATAASAQINGKSIKQIEVTELPDAKNAKEKESRRRTTNYANNTAWWGGRANKEAQHKIIMGSKIDSGTKV